VPGRAYPTSLSSIAGNRTQPRFAAANEDRYEAALASERST
jgi:hypothetical protein